MYKSIAVSLIALVAATPALAQQAIAQAQEAPAATQPPNQPLTDDDVDAIVVTAERIRGQVQSASAPVLELDEKQVESYGATSIADLVAQLSPQIGSGNGRGGRPVFLVNGQRITNFREIGRYPPEAIKKVEVLPEEVALKFGYSAQQRVINFILKDNFSNTAAELEVGAPTRGGYTTVQPEISHLAINGPQRLNIGAEYKTSSALTEAERGIIQTPGSTPGIAADPDPAAYRTLVQRSENLEVNVTSTSGLGSEGADGQLTLNSQWVHNKTTSLSGLDTVLLAAPGGATALRTLDADPITRRTNTDTLSIGVGFNKRLGDYQFQTTLDAGLTDTQSTIDRRRDGAALIDAAAAGALAIEGSLPAVGLAGTDLSRSKVYTASSKSTLIGNPFLLPAGELGVTLDAGYDWTRIESFDTRTIAGSNALTRGNLNAGANISIPIASRRDDVWAAIGDLTFNIGGGFDRLSDFGTLGNVTTGLVWKPLEPLTLNATYTQREAAPGLNELGGPTLVNFNVPAYDFRTGQSVLITQTSGGNPFLRAETQRDLKLSASYDLELLDRANILVEYYRNRSSDVTSSFPLLTPAIEAAFPGRVTRDAATGRLTALDVRPVTFSETRAERLRYGFNLSGKLGKPAPQGEGGARGGLFGMVARATSASSSSSAQPATSGASGDGERNQGARQGTGTPSGTRALDLQRFAELREKFCATPANQTPDLSALPQQMQDRLKGDDGAIDAARVAVMRTRLCSADGAKRFDPARFTAMRQALCADITKDPDPATIPEEVRNRLKGPDGTIAPDRLREFRTRICALPTGQDRGSGRGDGHGQASGDGSAPRGNGGVGGGHGGGRGGPGAGEGQGRWNASLYHTVNLVNSVLIAPGGPFLDLLGGDATGSGGGVSRHQFEFEGGAFYRGIGARLSGTYNTATTVRGTGLPGSSDLHFGDLATFDLRLFVALDQQKWLTGEDPGFLKNARLSLKVNNIFDAHQRVTDGNGVIPLRYQPFLIDPVGRFVEVEFRKLF